MKIAIVGDSFIDRYYFGKVKRISPEAPIPIFDVKRKEDRAGGAMNVANNLFGLGISPEVFTINTLAAPYPIISPPNPSPLMKIRYIAQNQQILRVDEPETYRKQDLLNFELPNYNDFDIVAFVDYDKGTIKGGKATILDSKKKDLTKFKGTEFLKINQGELEALEENPIQKAFITKGSKGIDYYEKGKKKLSLQPQGKKEVLDVTGAGDTVMATMIYCLANNITDPGVIIELCNRAAGIVIGKLGTSAISLDELNEGKKNEKS